MERILDATASDKRFCKDSMRALTREMRATLQHIAQEVGQWPKQQKHRKPELTGKEGEPLQTMPDLSRLSDEELETLERLSRKISDPAVPAVI